MLTAARARNTWLREGWQNTQANTLNLSSGPHGTLDQLTSSGAESDVRGLAGHPRRGQELRPQILHGDQLVVVDHLFRPDSRGVLGLAGGVLLDARLGAARLPVAPRRGVSVGPLAAGHLPLCPGEHGSATTTVPRIGQVVNVAPAYTSMTCSSCFARTTQRLGLAERTFRCQDCGYTDTRDRNAARTILALAERGQASADGVSHAAASPSEVAVAVRPELRIPRL
jgi:hypothetical protein